MKLIRFRGKVQVLINNKVQFEILMDLCERMGAYWMSGASPRSYIPPTQFPYCIEIASRGEGYTLVAGDEEDPNYTVGEFIDLITKLPERCSSPDELEDFILGIFQGITDGDVLYLEGCKKIMEEAKYLYEGPPHDN